MISKRKIRELENILECIMSVDSFIKSPHTVVTRVSRGHTTSEYKHKNAGAFNVPEFVMPINKTTGSDLCYLYKAKRQLQQFIKDN